MMENEESREKVGMAMMFAPVTMLGFNVELGIELDDFHEIEDHPMAEKLLLTFNDVFEMAMRASYQDVMDSTLDTQGLEEVEPKS